MPLIFTLIFILPPVIALAIFIGKRILEAVPFVFFGTIFYGYILSLFNLLPASVLTAQIAWGISVVYIIFSVVKKKNIQYDKLLFDTAIMVVMAAFFWWLCRGRYYNAWDEISHWGKVIQGMYKNDMLYCLANPLHSFNEYSPSVSIFQYIALKCMPFGFREDVSIFVQSIMYAYLLIWPVTKFSTKNITYKLLSGIALMLVPVTLFLQLYLTVLADPGMGVIFGFLMIYYFLEKDDLFKYLTLGLGCFVLALTKTAAIGFCVIVIIVILTNEIVNKKRIKAVITLPAICLGFTVFASISWKIFLKLYNINLRWTASDFSLGSILALFNGTAPTYRLETVRLFFTNIFTDRVYGFIIKFSFMEWFILLILLATLIVCMMKNNKRKGFAISFGVFLISIFLFTLSVLVSYLFYFSEGEAMGLASISRYLNPVIVAALIVIISFFLYEISHKKLSIQIISLVATFAVIVALGSPSILPFFKTCIDAPTQAAVTANIRNRFTEMSDELIKLEKDGKINAYVVAQRDTGLANMTFTYQLDPVILYPEQEASIGEKYGDWDIWTKFYTEESFEKELYDNFEYLCLFEIDEEFLQQFGGMFNEDSDMQSGNILKVEKLEAGKINLVRIK